MKHIEVVAAVIQFDDKILCVQRGVGKFDYISRKYEFPGGKVEAGESPKDALRREILEELHMNIGVGELFLSVEHTYPDFAITMHTYLCSADDPKLKLVEHIDHKWLHRRELQGLDWAAADIPIVDKLMRD